MSEDETIEELRNQNAELREELEVKNAELNKEKEKNKELENLCNRKEAIIGFMETAHKIDVDKQVNDTIEIATDRHFRELENYISKDKIKAKIEEYTEKSKHPLINAQSKREYTFGIRALQELLEEEE